MFVNIARTGIQPTGPVVYTGITTSKACRYRTGLLIEVRQVNTFQVFINGRFVLGWNTDEQAIACAERFGVEAS